MAIKNFEIYYWKEWTYLRQYGETNLIWSIFEMDRE